MIKKLTAIFICAVLLAAMLPFSVSAADSAAFRVRLAEQSNKTATVVVEFVSGTGFSAIDLSIKYNTLKFTLKEAKIGSGYAAFKNKTEDAGQSAIGSINSNGNPIKVSMANVEPFAAVNGDGALVRLSFKKVGGMRISESDIVVTFDNCQTGAFTDINASVSYDLTGAAAVAEGSTAYALQSSQDGVGQDGETADPTEIADATDASAKGSTAASAKNGQADTAETTGADANKPTSNKTKTIVVVIACVVFIGGIAAVVYVIIRSKKKTENEF